MTSTVTGSARSAVRSATWRAMLGIAVSTDGRGGTARRPGLLLPDSSMRVFGPIALILLFFAAGAQLGHGDPGRIPAALGFAAAQVAALALSWFLPLAGWRVSLLVTLLTGAVLTESSGAPWPLATLVAHLGTLFLLALSSTRPVAAAAVLVDAAVFVTWSLLWGARIEVVLAGPVVALLVGGFGAALGAQRRTAQALAVSQRDTVVSQALRGALEERARIARELHDVVAHHLSRIAVRAESAPVRVAGAGPEVTSELREIAVDARDALTDMRRLLGVLRTDDGRSPVVPAPGLHDLDELVAAVRRAGTRVTLSRTGELDAPVPPDVGLAGYRVVQEALSNAARHATGAAVVITVHHSPAGVRLGVRNDPPARGSGHEPTGADSEPAGEGPSGEGPSGEGPSGEGTGGHGLAGMRERVGAVEGTMSAGPDPDGGWTVRVTLPLSERGRT